MSKGLGSSIDNQVYWINFNRESENSPFKRSIPIPGGGLGMNKGAILAFFISGPATKISTLVTLNAAIKREAFVLYLVIAFTGAIFFGFFYHTLDI